MDCRPFETQMAFRGRVTKVLYRALWVELYEDEYGQARCY